MRVITIEKQVVGTKEVIKTKKVKKTIEVEVEVNEAYIVEEPITEEILVTYDSRTPIRSEKEFDAWMKAGFTTFYGLVEYSDELVVYEDCKRVKLPWTNSMVSNSTTGEFSLRDRNVAMKDGNTTGYNDYFLFVSQRAAEDALRLRKKGYKLKRTKTLPKKG